MTESQRDRNVCYNDGTCILSHRQYMLRDMRAFHVQSIVGPSNGYDQISFRTNQIRSKAFTHHFRLCWCTWYFGCVMLFLLTKPTKDHVPLNQIQTKSNFHIASIGITEASLVGIFVMLKFVYTKIFSHLICN